MLRLRVAAATIALAVAGLSVPPRTAAAAHPYFDDRGTLEWYRTLDEAQAVARRTGKLIFIDSGRLRCGNCRSLISDVLPNPRVRDRIGRIAIGLSDEIDRPDPRVMQLLDQGVPNAQMLPLVGFVTPELRWVTGWSGHTDPDSVCGYLSIAEARWDKVQKFRATLAPTPTPASTEPKPTEPRPAARPSTSAPAPHRDDSGCELPGRAKGGVLGSPTAPVLPPKPEPQAMRPAPSPSPAPERTPSVPVPPIAAPRPTPSGTTPRSPVAPPSPGTLLSRMRTAAATAQYGEVIRLAETESPSPAERPEYESLRQRAEGWVLKSMADAEAAARGRRFSEAMRTLTVLRAELSRTQCPALTDAERGERAIQCLVEIERGSPDSKGTPEEIRKQAYAEFRGTRWAALFRSRA